MKPVRAGSACVRERACDAPSQPRRSASQALRGAHPDGLTRTMPSSMVTASSSSGRGGARRCCGRRWSRRRRGTGTRSACAPASRRRRTAGACRCAEKARTSSAVRMTSTGRSSTEHGVHGADGELLELADAHGPLRATRRGLEVADDRVRRPRRRARPRCRRPPRSGSRAGVPPLRSSFVGHGASLGRRFPART